jgi:hypothetical protein
VNGRAQNTVSQPAVAIPSRHRVQAELFAAGRDDPRARGGVTKGGISLGLTRAGVPAELAFTIALSYRFAVFYLPPIWGYVSFRWLSARRYL